MIMTARIYTHAPHMNFIIVTFFGKEKEAKNESVVTSSFA